MSDIFHGESYVVICRDDGAPHATGLTVGQYTLATRQAFATRRLAQTYADTLAPTREALVVEGAWDQIRFGSN